MRKFALFLFLILSIIVFGVFRFGTPMLGIISGYSAKNMCSCVFIAGMEEDNVIEEDLNFSFLSWSDIEIDKANKSVKASVFGKGEKTAIYRDHIGCALVSSAGTKDIYRFKGEWPTQRFDSLVNWFDLRDTLQFLSRNTEQKVSSIVAGAFLEEEGRVKNTRAAVVIHKGKIIAEQYSEKIDKDTPLLGWSMTKSLTSTMFGQMQEEGMLYLEEKVPVRAWQKDGRAEIRWKDLLQMSSGLKFAEVYSFVSDATLMLYDSDNMGAYAESLPATNQPGEKWYYSSGTSNIIAYNLASSFPNLESYQLYLYNNFFYKIGAYSMVIETDASGYFVGSSYSWATARDWGRVGQVYVQNGNWDGEQVVPEEYIEFIRSPVAASDNSYGGHFWLNQGGYLPDVPRDVYSLNGFQGQRVFIVPSEDLVIVRLGLTYKRNDFDFNKWVSEIIKAVQEDNQ